MRKLILTLLSVLYLLAGTHAQYFVVNLKDTVYADNQVLTKKDRISSSAKLRFSSADAYAYVVAPGKGYFILGVKEKDKKSRGEFVLALKDALMPPNDYYAAATRTHETHEAALFEDQYDLKAFFRDRLFFMAPAKFKVAPQQFPLDSAHYFMIKHYLTDGWFAKPLPHVGQEFELNTEVFQLNGQIFHHKTVNYSELLYYNKTTGETQYLGQFKLHFVPASDIKEELMSLYQAVEPISLNQFMYEHALPYLNVQYGKTKTEAVTKIMESMPRGK
jgi:hypothetical protein